MHGQDELPHRRHMLPCRARAGCTEPFQDPPSCAVGCRRGSAGVRQAKEGGRADEERRHEAVGCAALATSYSATTQGSMTSVTSRFTAETSTCLMLHGLVSQTSSSSHLHLPVLWWACRVMWQPQHRLDVLCRSPTNTLHTLWYCRHARIFTIRSDHAGEGSDFLPVSATVKPHIEATAGLALSSMLSHPMIPLKALLGPVG